MKAALLTELNAPLTLADVQPGPLAYGLVLVRVITSGICGAQLQEIRGEKGGPLPHLLGHEGCGEVLEVGAGVSRMKVGDRVVMHWRKAAGVESSFPVYEYGDRIISSGRVVTFAEQAVCSENRLTPVPAGTSPDLCALLGCGLSTALGALEEEGLRFGESVLIIGLGGLGLSLLAALELTSPGRVCCCDIHENKRRHTDIAGADFRNLTREKLDGVFDLVLDTAGDAAAMTDAIDHLAPSGRYVMIGQPGPGRAVSIPNARRMFEGEGKRIRATQGGGFQPEADIARYLLAAESLALHNLVTHRFPLDRINDALDLVRAGEAGRVILDMV